MSHPSLEPRFDVATVFADPGIGWLELCKRGVHKRVTAGRNRDELQYLRGWCSALAGDVDRACGSLAPLTRSAVLGIPAAIRTDLANILASSGDADKAEHWLTKHNIRDIELLDTLAATYVEIGNEQDARVINRRAMDSDVDGPVAATCRRLVREIVLSPEGERVLPVSQLEQIMTVPRLANPTCVELHHAVQCWRDPGSGCWGYLGDQRLDKRYSYLLIAFHRWPRGAATEKTWLRIANDALIAADLPGAADIVETALDAAARSTAGCELSTYRRVDQAVETLRKVATVPPSLKALHETCRLAVGAAPS